MLFAEEIEMVLLFLAWLGFVGAVLTVTLQHSARCESLEDLMLVAMLHP